MFKRRKQPPAGYKTTSLSQLVALRLRAIQAKWAGWMQYKTQHWTKREQKRFLFVLCLVMGGCSTHSLLQLFTRKSTVPVVISTPQSLPPLIHSPPEKQSLPPVADTMVFYRFQKHIDSLQQSLEGRNLYNRFLEERPGFMDSLRQAEELIKYYPFSHY